MRHETRPANLHRMEHRTGHPQHGQAKPSGLSGLLGGLAFLAAIILAWVLAYYASGWFYARAALHPAPLLRQVVTSLLGVLFLAVPSIVISFMHRPREQAAFVSILAAIARIAKGDFHARVETPLPSSGHPFTQLVHSINDMAADLSRMEALRQEFISNVSHEIQSPLTSIAGFAKALRDESLDPAQRRRYAEIIESESERLSKLSDNLMRLTELEGDHPPLEPRPYRVDAQLRRVILALEPQWAAKAIDMELDGPALTLTADEDLMEHVFLNLVHNAVKFTPEGGTVRVVARSGDGWLSVEVDDNGIGIAPEDQERVFERFFKADRARSHSAGGSGLGLALAAKIVSLHGGSIGIESAVGHGARFRVRLPLLGPPVGAARIQSRS